MRILLVIGCQHLLESLGLQHTAKLAAASVHQSCQVNGHFIDARHHRTGSMTGEFNIGHGFELAFFENIPLCQFVLHPICKGVVTLMHAQRIEDIAAHIIDKGLASYIFDQLPQRGKGIVGVSPLLFGVNIRHQQPIEIFLQRGYMFL